MDTTQGQCLIFFLKIPIILKIILEGKSYFLKQIIKAYKFSYAKNERRINAPEKSLT